MERFRFPVSGEKRGDGSIPASVRTTLLTLQKAGIDKFSGSADKDAVRSWCDSLAGELDPGVKLLVVSYAAEKAIHAGEVHRLEIHRHHIDVQLCLNGSEGIAVAPASELNNREPWNAKDDVEFGVAPVREVHVLSYPDVFVLLPGDAHMGGVTVEPGRQIVKIVAKIDLNAR